MRRHELTDDQFDKIRHLLLGGQISLGAQREITGCLLTLSFRYLKQVHHSVTYQSDLVTGIAHIVALQDGQRLVFLMKYFAYCLQIAIWHSF